jgi:hypothetical protein
VKVTTLEVADEVGTNAAVTPVGSPEAANVTLPVKPFSSVTAIVLVMVPGRATVRDAGEAARVKLGVPVTVSVIEAATGVSVPEVPVMVIG